MGRVTFNKKGYLGIQCRLRKAHMGESIAVNGVCLTVVKVTPHPKAKNLFFDLSQETLDRTTFGKMKSGTIVNLEPALGVHDVLGGHIVQGHVDGVGQVTRVIKQPEGMKTIWFKAPKDVRKYLVYKGSVAVDGVSLTVSQLKKDLFAVALIPHTLKETNMGRSKPGDPVNLEADIIGKYVVKYLENRS